MVELHTGLVYNSTGRIHSLNRVVLFDMLSEEVLLKYGYIVHNVFNGLLHVCDEWRSTYCPNILLSYTFIDSYTNTYKFINLLKHRRTLRTRCIVTYSVLKYGPNMSSWRKIS